MATPDARPTYECFEYEGWAIFSGPLFNVVMLTLSTRDPATFALLKELLGADHID